MLDDASVNSLRALPALVPAVMIEGILIEVVELGHGGVKLTIDMRPDNEGPEFEYFTTTPEQAQVILAKCRLGSQVRVTTSVAMEPVDPVGVSEPVMGERQELAKTPNKWQCGEYRKGPCAATFCTRPSGHTSNHANHRVAWW